MKAMRMGSPPDVVARPPAAVAARTAGASDSNVGRARQAPTPRRNVRRLRLGDEGRCIGVMVVSAGWRRVPWRPFLRGLGFAGAETLPVGIASDLFAVPAAA